MWVRTFVAGVLVVLACISSQAQTLDKIKQRGVLVVGTKVDFKPFGFRDANGAVVGFEPDLATEVANRLGVRLEVEPVRTSNRMQLLQEGKIDLLIATMNDRPDRRKIVGIVDPPYYSSGVSLMASKKSQLDDWMQLKGQTVCGMEGAWYNQTIAEKYGATFTYFKTQPELEAALLQGTCIGWVRDDIAFVGGASDPMWVDFHKALPAILDEPIVAAVRSEERDGDWGRFVHSIIEDWHRTGRLIELEAKWKIPASPFLKSMHEVYRQEAP